MRKIRQVFSFLIPVIAFAALVVFMTGCEKQKAAKVEELKATTRRVVEEAWNKGNLDVLDEHYAADIAYHIPPYPDIEGLEALKQYITNVRSSFPDHQITIDEIVVEGDTSAVRWTWRGTHTGESPIMPIPPTGKQATMTGCCVAHWEEGKVVEQWEYADHLGLLQQLGVVPPMKKGGE